MKQYFVITFLFTQLFAFDGYLRQNEVSGCQDECSQYYIEPEIDGGFGTVPIFFQDYNIDIELYLNRFVEIDLGQEVNCVECSAFEVLEIQLSADCEFIVNCFQDPCTVADPCGTNQCEANYCGGCNADFYDLNGDLVDCSLTTENNIEGRWHLVGYEDNVMYQFEDDYRYSIYSEDGTFGSIEDGGGTPNPYTVVEDIITIDLFFGNIANYQMNYICDGQVVEFKNTLYETIHSILSREGYSYIDNECEEIESLECTELNQNQCYQGDGCDWVEYIEVANCYNLSWSEQECLSNNGCSYNCTSYYGCWCSGEYEINNSFCEEVNFMLGDVNNDGSLNVLDIVLIVDLILNSEYDEHSDVNQDGILNILDIVTLVNIILNN